MDYIRIDSIQGTRVRIVVEVSVEEYNRIINEENRQAENNRQNEADRQRERQWYGNDEVDS